MDVHLWQEIGIISGAIMGSGAVVVAVFKYVFVPMRDAARRAGAAINELHPNGGGSIRDAITRIDYATQKSGARWAALVNREKVAIYECAPSGACTFANKEACALFGLDKTHMMGNGWLEGIIPEDRERVFDAWATAVAKNLPYESKYTVRNAKTKKLTSVTTTAEPMFDRDRRILGYHGVLEVENIPDQ